MTKAPIVHVHYGAKADGFDPLGDHVTMRRECARSQPSQMTELRTGQFKTKLLVCPIISPKIIFCICTNDLACRRGYYVGLVFRKISLRLDEQKNLTEDAPLIYT